MDKNQLLSLLGRARESQDIYTIARAALMLKGRGYDAPLTAIEHSAILLCLQNARIKKGILGLETGYELARWILICQYIFPDKELVPTDADQLMIQEACNTYCAERILKQVASLVHMGKVLNIPININRLPPKKRKYVLKLAVTLS